MNATSEPMRAGILYDLYEDYPWLDGEPDDAAAENEPLETVEAIESALRIAGYEPIRVGGARHLMARLDEPGFDVAVNIAEGARSRNREGQVPTLLELAGIPFAGSDALTLSLSLDKAWTKDLAAAVGVPTPPHRVYSSGEAVRAENLPAEFPLFVKPRYEGSAKGLNESSRTSALDELQREVDRLVTGYGQDALVEPFIDGGGEFTVAVIGDPPRALPAIQRAVDRATGIGLHVLERLRGSAPQTGHHPRTPSERPWDLPGDLTGELEDRLRRHAVAVFEKLECRDFARVDFRVDASGKPWFLEINPLPTFRPGDTFAIAAELEGVDYGTFLADVLGGAVERALSRAGTNRPARRAPLERVSAGNGARS